MLEAIISLWPITENTLKNEVINRSPIKRIINHIKLIHEIRALFVILIHFLKEFILLGQYKIFLLLRQISTIYDIVNQYKKTKRTKSFIRF